MPVLPNPRHESFAQERARGKSIDEAYQIAGFKPNRSNASRLNANEHIRARVDEIVGRGAVKAEATVARVLEEMRRLGFSDLRNAFDENGNLLSPSEWSDDFAASVSSIKVVTKTLPGQPDEGQEPQAHGGTLTRRSANVEYVHEIKVWDKNSALEKLAKHLGMFIDRIDHMSSDGSMSPKPTRIEFVAPQVDDESDD